jgi:Flagellar protein YcgR/PilZ domain
MDTPATSSDRQSAQRLDDLRLPIGTPLQLQMATGDRQRSLCRLVGYVNGGCVIVTTPVVDGVPQTVVEDRQFIVRGFSGKEAFAFPARVVKVMTFPFAHLYLSYPKQFEHVGVRKAERVAVKIIGLISRLEAENEAGTPIMIDDLSASGCSMKAVARVAGRGDPVRVSFRLNLCGAETYISAAGVIRSEKDIDPEATADGPVFWARYGVEFTQLSPPDRMALENIILRELLTN